MNSNQFNTEFFKFLQRCPSAFHTTKYLANSLKHAGFTELLEKDDWKLEKSNGYYCIRDDGSIIGIKLAADSPSEKPWRMTAAHSDSPALQLKPRPTKTSQSSDQLCVEVYGGPLLSTWFDRDLSLAGRVSITTAKGELKSLLVDFSRAVATIPNLAIHLNRNANTDRTVNKQTEMPPLMLLCEEGEEITFNSLLTEELEAQHSDLKVGKILDYELSFYDFQPASFTGLRQDFISSARIDNLMCTYIGLQSLLQAGNDCTSVFIGNDHEECGSNSTSGAGGPFLERVLQRITVDQETFSRTMPQSMLISADNAHAVHPNYSDKHDGNHQPRLNGGPVIKVNSNQRYATNSITSSLFMHLCDQVDVPVQKFINRSDMGCGSTIGPMTASRLGIKTIDIGLPMLAMHSIREMAGCKDTIHLYKVLIEFFNHSN